MVTMEVPQEELFRLILVVFYVGEGGRIDGNVVLHLERKALRLMQTRTLLAALLLMLVFLEIVILNFVADSLRRSKFEH